jgi:hypothetical protein
VRILVVLAKYAPGRPPRLERPALLVDTKQIGTDDVGVMWRMVDGVPTIAWTGFDNFTPITP